MIYFDPIAYILLYTYYYHYVYEVKIKWIIKIQISRFFLKFSFGFYSYSKYFIEQSH